MASSSFRSISVISVVQYSFRSNCADLDRVEIDGGGGGGDAEEQRIGRITFRGFSERQRCEEDDSTENAIFSLSAAEEDNLLQAFDNGDVNW